MRLLIYGINYKPELVGIGKYTGEMSEWLVKSGHEVNVICAPKYFPHWESKKNKYYSETINGVKIFRCPIYLSKKSNFLYRIFHYLSFSLSSIPYLIKNLKFKPDLIIVISPSFLCTINALIFSLISKSNPKKWIHIQDLEIDLAFKLGIINNQFFKKLVLYIEKKLLIKFDQISTIGYAMKSTLIKKGIKSEKIIIIPNWVDNSLFRCANKFSKKNIYSKKYKKNHNKTIIMYSGSLNEKQDLDLIINSINFLKNQINILWFFSIEGKSKNKLIKKVGFYKNVYILPLQPNNNIIEWFSFSDICIIPQKKNIDDFLLPSKLLPILSCGKPFIATAKKDSELGTIADLAGIRIEPQDYINFSKAILELSINKERRQKLGNNGRNISLNKFDKEKILTFLNQKLDEIKL